MYQAWRASEAIRSVAAVIVGTLLLWEISVHVFHIREFVAPAPSVVFQALVKSPNFYFQHALTTLWVTLAGFGLAVVFGIVFAIGIIHSVWLERTLHPFLVGLNSLPKVALAPLFVIWFGTGSASKTAVAISIAIFPIVIDSVLGLRSVDPEVINMARAMRASQGQILWKIRFPQALPSLFAGMKVSISLALVGTVVGEFIAGNKGLGSAILAAQATFDTPQVFASIILLAILGTILFYAVDFMERRLIPWHSSHRSHKTSAAVI
jgi:NitT/TauT family transport system permease protein